MTPFYDHRDPEDERFGVIIAVGLAFCLAAAIVIDVLGGLPL